MTINSLKLLSYVGAALKPSYIFAITDSTQQFCRNLKICCSLSEITHFIYRCNFPNDLSLSFLIRCASIGASGVCKQTPLFLNM